MTKRPLPRPSARPKIEPVGFTDDRRDKLKRLLLPRGIKHARNIEEQTRIDAQIDALRVLSENERHEYILKEGALSLTNERFALEKAAEFAKKLLEIMQDARGELRLKLEVAMVNQARSSAKCDQFLISLADFTRNVEAIISHLPPQNYHSSNPYVIWRIDNICKGSDAPISYTESSRFYQICDIVFKTIKGETTIPIASPTGSIKRYKQYISGQVRRDDWTSEAWRNLGISSPMGQLLMDSKRQTPIATWSPTHSVTKADESSASPEEFLSTIAVIKGAIASKLLPTKKRTRRK
jgi:hypothetical protein